MKSSREELLCEECGARVRDKDTFCPQCGGIFEAPLFCVVHPGVEAEGVCVICRKAFCPACGSKVNKLSLCESHAGYEILEGRARVFGSLDNVQARFAASCLEQAGLHPFFYSRFFNPGVAIGPQWSWRLFDGHITQEMKVFVPFDEVLEAGKVLADLKL